MNTKSHLQKQQIRHELHIICRYRSLLLARLCTVSLLLPGCILQYPVSLYLAAALLLFPLIIQALLSDGMNTAAQADHASSAPETILKQTMKKYHYSDIRYRVESLFSIPLVFFLGVWQISLSKHPLHNDTADMLPLLLIIIYLICRISIYCYYRILLHYRFTHLCF